MNKRRIVPIWNAILMIEIMPETNFIADDRSQSSGRDLLETSMESFHWDKHFETGLATVDAQHHTLVDLINAFGEMLMQSSVLVAADVEPLFQQLAAYALHHFQEEEDLMRGVGLDDRHTSSHIQAHVEFVQELTQMYQDLAREQETAQHLLKFLTYWLAFHILGMDQSMAKQVSAIQAGQPAEQAYLAEIKEKDGATEPLLRALNGLFGQVTARNHDLRELNRSLEQKVDERTRSLSEANQLLEQIAMTDALTGLPNRRSAMARFAMIWSEAARDTVPMSCVMMDADGFKRINDQYGHDAGDEVLRQLARRLSHAVRTDDLVCRLGGDEFLVICPNTAVEGAMLAAENIRRDVAALQVALPAGGEWLGSISVGVAARTSEMQGIEDLIKAADEGLYAAKRNGRNRVECNPQQAVALGESRA